jgi:glycosyltransferase involved in cell wall biosynthesis
MASRRPEECRILVDSLADEGLTNAQMSNAREIVVRLDPERFHITLFHTAEPSERIRSRPNTRLVCLPAHRQSARILQEFVTGSHDILFYLKVAPASKWYMQLRRIWSDRRVVIGTIESRADLRNEPTIPPSVVRMWEQTVLRCDYLFANSKAVKESLQREYALDCEIVPTGVDTQFFAPATVQRNNSRPCVLFVGSLRPFKQPQLVLDAACRFPEADFVIVGDGVSATELKERARREMLANVTLLGALSPEGLRDQYQKADIFFFPSTWEGSPKVILEAAACALPVIARQSYQPESVISGQTGFLATSDAELFGRLGELLLSPEMRRSLGGAGRKHVEVFDWDRIVPQWADIFLRLKAAKAGS